MFRFTLPDILHFTLPSLEPSEQREAARANSRCLARGYVRARRTVGRALRQAYTGECRLDRSVHKKMLRELSAAAAARYVLFDKIGDHRSRRNAEARRERRYRLERQFHVLQHPTVNFKAKLPTITRKHRADALASFLVHVRAVLGRVLTPLKPAARDELVARLFGIFEKTTVDAFRERYKRIRQPMRQRGVSVDEGARVIEFVLSVVHKVRSER